MSRPCFEKETYESDILEFTGRTLQDWRDERLKWLKLYGNSYDDVASIQGFDFDKATFEGLVSCYNHPARLAEVYTNTAQWIVHSRVGQENLGDPRFKIFKYFLGEEKKRVLDHGCKDGSHSWTFWNQGYHVTMADLPLDYLKFIDWRIKKYNITDIEVTFVNDKLDFLEERVFDLIFSREVMEHCINPHKVLAYLSDHLKMDGLFYLTVGFTGGQYHLMRNHDLFCVEPGKVGNTNGNKRWQQCLKDAGLDVYPVSMVIPDDLVGKEPFLFIKKRNVDWSKFDFE